MNAVEDSPTSDTVRLTSRLVNQDSMKRAIEELLSNARHYIWGIKRLSFDMSSGQDQTADLVLSEDDHLVMDEHIDLRLLKARRVNLAITVKDGGTATITFKPRFVNIVADSPDLRKALADFRRSLRAGARSRWVTSTGIVILLLSPIALFFAALFTENATYPKSNGHHPVYNEWFSVVGNASLLLLLATALIACIIYVIIWRSGPLRIWPQGLTLKSALRAIYRIKVSDSLHRHATTIMVTVVASVISGVLVFLFTRV
jgi:hypothetical protein